MVSGERQDAKRKQEGQADKMKERSNKRFKVASSGDNVVVRIPDVDRGRGDHRTVMAVVLSSDERGYRLGTSHGVLKQLFVRSMFEVCSSNGFLDSENVPKDREISLREAATNASVGSGQGMLRCDLQERCLHVQQMQM